MRVDEEGQNECTVVDYRRRSQRRRQKSRGNRWAKAQKWSGNLLWEWTSRRRRRSWCAEKRREEKLLQGRVPARESQQLPEQAVVKDSISGAHGRFPPMEGIPGNSDARL